ncbi:MAG: peptide deformylase [Myxococcota bacterium]|jgi:peptide deformylase|nr:peptide deformylase [Myxococcota bacterium]
MAILPILTYPDERLKQDAKPVTVFDEKLRKLADDMAETMYAAPGVGLAANQVGVLAQVVVLDTSYSEGRPNLIVLVNPEILEAQDTMEWEEGCLSLPEVHENVKRHRRVKVRAMDVDGNPFEVEAEGNLLAAALQHEIDHLKGVVLLDRLGLLKRRALHRTLLKRKAAAG